MKVKFFTSVSQAQETLLRLFVEPASYSPRSSSVYTCAHCGTYAKLHG